MRDTAALTRSVSLKGSCVVGLMSAKDVLWRIASLRVAYTSCMSTQHSLIEAAGSPRFRWGAAPCYPQMWCVSFLLGTYECVYKGWARCIAWRSRYGVDAASV